MPTITLQPDESSGYDSYTTNYNNTINYGTETILRTGVQAGYAISEVIKFDLSPLVRATIISATIYQTCVAYGGSQTLTFYGCLRNWVESEVCGAYYSGTNPWTVGCGNGPGTDRDASSAGAMSVTGTGQFSASLSASLFQEWVNGVRQNYGFVAIGYFANNVYNDFASSSHATASYRPKLVIDFVRSSGGVCNLSQGFGVM